MSTPKPPIAHREDAQFRAALMVAVMLTVACGRTPEPTATTRDAAPPIPDAADASIDVEQPDAQGLDAADAAVATPVVDPTTFWTPPKGWTGSPPLEPSRRCFLAPAVAKQAKRAEVCVSAVGGSADDVLSRWTRLFPKATPTVQTQRLRDFDTRTFTSRGDRAFVWDGDTPMFQRSDWELRGAVVDVGTRRLVFELMGPANSMTTTTTAAFDAAWKSFRWDAARAVSAITDASAGD